MNFAEITPRDVSTIAYHTGYAAVEQFHGVRLVPNPQEWDADRIAASLCRHYPTWLYGEDGFARYAKEIWREGFLDGWRDGWKQHPGILEYLTARAQLAR